MTFKTDWLPTDTYDVKTDFVRIFGNAAQLITKQTWGNLSSKTWGVLSTTTWSSPGSGPYVLKTDWEYSDVIKKSYFTDLINAINYFILRTLKRPDMMIDIGNITLSARLLNTIERTEEKIYEIYKQTQL